MHWNEDTLELELVATLSGKVSEASLQMLKQQDQLDAELRRLLKQGYSIDSLSAATGLAPDAIRKRAELDIDYL